jgi:DNA polymerase V
MYAIVDANNFYCECQRLFAPHLVGRPVVVLSNNDGNLISRSAEAKAIEGLGMGEPYFQVRHLLEQHRVAVFSSNYELYGSISGRIMRILARAVPEIEIYSIDEAFLDLHGMEKYHGPLDELAQGLRAEVKRCTGIPTCVGVAPTKTLAKLANRLAKKRPELQGVCYLNSDERRRWALELVAVEDVWGIGRQYAAKLHAAGIGTAADLARCSEAWARKHLGGVVGARLVRELQGTPCLALAESEDGSLSRRSLCKSGSFGQPLSAWEDVLGAVSDFTSRAAVKLRRQGDVAHVLTVFLSKNRYGIEPPPYSCSAVLTLPVGSSDTVELLRLARAGLARLWQPGTRYTKAGVVLDGLEPAGGQQLGLFAAGPAPAERTQLMAQLDALNQRFGRGTVRLARRGPGRGCRAPPGREKRSGARPRTLHA